MNFLPRVFSSNVSRKVEQSYNLMISLERNVMQGQANFLSKSNLNLFNGLIEQKPIHSIDASSENIRGLKFL